MKRLAALVSSALFSAGLVAATNSGFGVDAFNRAVSAATRGNAVFSPVSFEVDCVIFSEAFGALTRAKVAETMGVLTGLESFYQPLSERLTEAMGGCCGPSFLTARAFCLPDERKSNRAYRQWLQNAFSAEAFTFDRFMLKGAESWFRARLDGAMEDFSPPEDAAQHNRYSYYDLVSVTSFIGEPSQTNRIVGQRFTLQDGKVREVPAVSASLPVAIWKRSTSTAVKIPLAGNAWFYALVPQEGRAVRDIRGDFCSVTLTDLLAGFKSITDGNVHSGVSTVVVPVMDVTTESDLKLPFDYFHFPLAGMERLDHEMQPQYIRQRLRFRLGASAPDMADRSEKPAEAGAADAAVPIPLEIAHFELDRPFLFFVYHEPTETILVSGQFMGL